jgi:hypothetical protein
MSDYMVRRILHEDLNFHSYKMVMIQAINDQGNVNKKTVCEGLLNALDNDDLNHILMTDEANFHLCGNVNSQNRHYWATENARNIHLYILRKLLFGVVHSSIFWGDQLLFL